MAQSDQIWSKMLHLGSHHKENVILTLLYVVYVAFWVFICFLKGFICSYNGPLGAPRRASKVWKWVGDAYPVNMGQLDHLVVFGTKSGAAQDFQRGKKCPRGFKQTPLHPLKHPQTPIKTPPNPLNPNH